METVSNPSKPSRGDIAFLLSMVVGWFTIHLLNPVAMLQKPWSAALSEQVRGLLFPLWGIVAMVAIGAAVWTIRRYPKRTVLVTAIATIVTLSGFVPYLKLTRDAEAQVAQRAIAESIADRTTKLQGLQGKELEAAARSLVRDLVFEMTGQYPSKPLNDEPLQTSTKEISR